MPDSLSQTAPPEDMFSDVDPAAGGAAPGPMPAETPAATPAVVAESTPEIAAAPPVAPTMDGQQDMLPVVESEQAASVAPVRRRRIGRGTRIRLLILGIAIFVVVLLAVLVYVFGGTQSNTTTAPAAINTGSVEDILDTVEPIETPVVSGAETADNTNSNDGSGITAPTQVADSDGDGLLDAKEINLGTNPFEVDTDQDGITDRQEVEIYETNPKSADTDGDGFSDGDEVRNFYNPNGPGKLIDQEQAFRDFEQE